MIMWKWMKIDWNHMKNLNSVSWIKIFNEMIDDGIIKSSEKGYYLNKN